MSRSNSCQRSNWTIIVVIATATTTTTTATTMITRSLRGLPAFALQNIALRLVQSSRNGHNRTQPPWHKERRNRATTAAAAAAALLHRPKLGRSLGADHAAVTAATAATIRAAGAGS